MLNTRTRGIILNLFCITAFTILLAVPVSGLLYEVTERVHPWRMYEPWKGFRIFSEGPFGFFCAILLFVVAEELLTAAWPMFRGNWKKPTGGILLLATVSTIAPVLLFSWIDFSSLSTHALQTLMGIAAVTGWMIFPIAYCYGIRSLMRRATNFTQHIYIAAPALLALLLAASAFSYLNGNVDGEGQGVAYMTTLPVTLAIAVGTLCDLLLLRRVSPGKVPQGDIMHETAQ